MNRNNIEKGFVAAGALSILCLWAAGCQQNAGGETVPAPPRALAEESLRRGNAPNPRPGGAAPAGAAAGARP